MSEGHTCWRRRGWDQPDGKKVAGKGTYSWRGQRTGLDMTRKESEPVMGTYPLARSEVGTGRDMKRKRAGERHSPAGKGRGRDLSGRGKKVKGSYPLGRAEEGTGWPGRGKKVNWQGAITHWRGQR